MAGRLKKYFNKIKKYNSVIEEYKKRGKVPSLPYKAFVNFADYLFLRGSYKQSEEILNSAVDFLSSSSEPYINLGILKQAENQLDKAEEYFKKAFEKDPQNVKSLCLWGNCLTAKGEYEKALKKYEHAEVIDKSSSDISICKSNTYVRMSDYQSAYDTLVKALKLRPKDIKIAYMLATVEVELAKYDDALARYEKIVSVSPEFFSAYHGIAYIYFKKKEYKKSIIAAQNAIMLFPLRLETYLLLGDVFFKEDNYYEAIDTYKKAEAIGLTSMFLYVSWGMALEKLEKTDEALEKYKKAVDFDEKGTNDELYSKIADLYAKKDEFKDAEEYALKALVVTKDNTVANKVMAELYMSKGKYREAIELLEKYSRQTGQKKDYYRKLGKCYSCIDDVESAKKYYSMALEYDRDNVDLLKEYINFLIKAGDWSTADNKYKVLEKLTDEEYDVLVLSFVINYNIAKDDIYSYNLKKAIMIADKIKEKYSDKFEFEEELEILKNLRGSSSE